MQTKARFDIILCFATGYSWQGFVILYAKASHLKDCTDILRAILPPPLWQERVRAPDRWHCEYMTAIPVSRQAARDAFVATQHNAHG